jgi:hypothetical protein
MALLTVAQIREHVETDLSNDALQRIIDSEDGEITRRFGAPTTQTETFKGGESYVFLSRLASSITSVTEEVNETTTTLAVDDYDLWWNQALQRDADGTNGRGTWGERVTVVYVPQTTTPQRTLLLIQLVQLAVQYGGVQSDSVGSGDYSATYHDYQRERERLFRKLEPRGGVFLA